MMFLCVALIHGYCIQILLYSNTVCKYFRKNLTLPLITTCTYVYVHMSTLAPLRVIWAHWKITFHKVQCHIDHIWFSIKLVRNNTSPILSILIVISIISRFQHGWDDRRIHWIIFFIGTDRRLQYEIPCNISIIPKQRNILRT